MVGGGAGTPLLLALPLLSNKKILAHRRDPLRFNYSLILFRANARVGSTTGSPDPSLPVYVSSRPSQLKQKSNQYNSLTYPHL